MKTYAYRLTTIVGEHSHHTRPEQFVLGLDRVDS